MRALGKSIGIPLLGILVLHALVIVIFETIRGVHSPYLDTSIATATAFQTEPKMIVYGRDVVSSNPKQTFFLGSSNARETFRVEDFEVLIPEGTVFHNASLSASNVTQIHQVVDLILEDLSVAQRESATFVIGVWYGIFVSDQARWKSGVTDLEREMYRLGLYSQSNGGLAAKFPTWWRNQLTRLAMPFLEVSARWQHATQALKTELTPKKAKARKCSPPTTQACKDEVLEFWEEYMDNMNGKLSAQQFRSLERLTAKILKAKSSVVLVDMPIPDWHSQESRYFQDYNNRQGIRALCTSETVKCASLREFSAEDYFYDSIHPKPKHVAEIIGKLDLTLLTGS